MEFEPSPAVSDKDRTIASTERVHLAPVHSDVTLPETPQSNRLNQTQGQGKSFSFDAEDTEKAAAEAEAARGNHHHGALITAAVVCGVFVLGIIVLQISNL